jgi:hypothetical protein
MLLLRIIDCFTICRNVKNGLRSSHFRRLEAFIAADIPSSRTDVMNGRNDQYMFYVVGEELPAKG